MSATSRMVDFIVDVTSEEIPEEARLAGRRAMLDTVGVTLAGVEDEGPAIVRRILQEEAAQGQATVLGTHQRTSLASAAWANGVAGHALDFDDVGGSISGHPSIPVLPAVLAIGESLEASGRDALDAFLIGFEVEGKIGRGVGRSHYARGFHATTTLGSMGSTAAAARLLKLNKEQTAHALGIAGSLAGGMRANFGSMTKPLQAGNAARAGVLAALLARDNFTGGEDILDGPIGFVRLFSPADDTDIEAVDDPGAPWEILSPGLSVKKYPCCFVTHRAADAALTIREQHGITAEDIERIEVHVPASAFSASGVIGPLIHQRPRTGLEGKFSMEYVVASAFIDGELRLANFDDDSVQRPAAQSLLRRVATIGDQERYPGAEDDQYQAVQIHTRDGQVWSQVVKEARGGPTDPLSWDELVVKYEDCASRALPADQVARSLEMLANLDDLRSVRELTAQLVPAAAS